MARFDKGLIALNAICPYFTMFPLDFPLGILSRWAKPRESVLDPFCGRGTTNFAARLLGLRSLGIDSSPVAAAITAAKLPRVTPDEVVKEARAIASRKTTGEIPGGRFWQLAYDPHVLESLCKFRTAFLDDCTSPARSALRAIMMGALHGPQQRTFPSYFSNQCPRTYAPKPAYAARFWRTHGFRPQRMDILDVVGRRARRFYNHSLPGRGVARLGDSRLRTALRNQGQPFDWVVTSPPYYGMRTYIPDQWLRNWFVGGPSVVDYSNTKQVHHGSPEEFAADLQRVWENARAVCDDNARLVIRFGGIADRDQNPRDIIRASLHETGWDLLTIKPAGKASDGRRQADTFLRKRSKPLEERVVWARAA